MSDKQEFWKSLRSHMEENFDSAYQLVLQSGIPLDGDFRESISLDTMNFLLCLCAKDGNISSSEIDFINTLFDYKFSEEDWMNYLKERGILSQDYLSTPPYSLEIIVAAENRLKTRINFVSKNFGAPSN